MNRNELIDAIKALGYKNYHFKDHSDGELYHIYQWALKKADEKKKSIEYNDSQIKNTLDDLGDWITQYKGYDIYFNGDYIVKDLNMRFSTEEEAIDYIDYTIDDDIDSISETYAFEEKRKRKNVAGWHLSFGRDPEKEAEIFNHNMKYNDSFNVSHETSDSNAEGSDSSSASGGEA